MSFLVTCGVTGQTLMEGQRARLTFLSTKIANINYSEKDSDGKPRIEQKAVDNFIHRNFDNFLMKGVVGDCASFSFDQEESEEAIRVLEMALRYGSGKKDNSSHDWLNSRNHVAHVGEWIKANRLGLEAKEVDGISSSSDIKEILMGLSLKELNDEFKQLMSDIRNGNVYFQHSIQHVLVSYELCFISEDVFDAIQDFKVEIDVPILGFYVEIGGLSDFKVKVRETLVNDLQKSFDGNEERIRSMPTMSYVCFSFSVGDLMKRMNIADNYYSIISSTDLGRRAVNFGKIDFDSSGWAEQSAERMMRVLDRLLDIGFLNSVGVILNPSKYASQDYGNDRGMNYLRVMNKVSENVVLRAARRRLDVIDDQEEVDEEELKVEVDAVREILKS